MQAKCDDGITNFAKALSDHNTLLILIKCNESILYLPSIMLVVPKVHMILRSFVV